MTEKTSSDNTRKGGLILYQTEDGRTRIECRFERRDPLAHAGADG
ncbi:uncharacterized protein SOCE836_016360 [Sorangium cellulosum]|uniref:Uncharacterized protein n=1 Tax=Sorangium cellulosum TaxID=56 RepID=A0A4P2QI40_SORCE|nr:MULTISPECIES: hypothetical protein [Sorangium]AUX29545.1 uncharacterized protein SOCE836_016360 [Sorangium cellulosum]WCQ88941.1 hypothetical protein NQZ70_01624 [Sorangium sp. Soce836]